MNSPLPTSLTSEKLRTLAAFTALFLIYIAFPTKNYYYDGIFFARLIETSKGLNGSLLHPNHLIYTPFGYLVYHLSRSLGLTYRAVEVLTFLNSIAGVLSVYVLFRIMKRTFPPYVAWCVTFLFAFAMTWWKFSTDANAYIISTLLLLLSFYLLLSTHKYKLPLLVISFCLGVLFHQLAVLFYPVIILGLLQQVDREPTRNSLVFAVAAFLIVFGTYYFLFYLASGSTEAGRFARWISSYSPDASFSFNALRNLSYTFRGHGRLFFGGRVSAIQDLLSFWIVVLLIVWVGLIAALFFKSVQTIRDWRGQTREPLKQRLRFDTLAKLCILWILMYEVFLFFWLPQNTFYRLFYLPDVVLLIGWVISRIHQEPIRHYRLALFVGIMAISNFLFSIFPFAHVQKNPPLALALEMNRVWADGTVVYYASESTDNNLFQYFNPSTNWKSLSTTRLESDIGPMSRNGASVWLDSSAIDLISSVPAGAEWLATHERAGSRRELVDRSYRIRFIEITP